MGIAKTGEAGMLKTFMLKAFMQPAGEDGLDIKCGKKN